MQVNRDSIIHFLRQQKPYLEKEFGVTAIALFGSYARGEETPTSDIDIAIELKKIDFEKRYELKEFLEKQFNRTVDVGYLHTIRPFIRKRIEAELIYA